MTEVERRAKRDFEQALSDAWEAYYRVEGEAMLARQEAIHRAHDEFVRSTGKQAVFVR